MLNLCDLYSWVFEKVRTICLDQVSAFIKHQRSQVMDEIIVQPQIENLESTID